MKALECDLIAAIHDPETIGCVLEVTLTDACDGVAVAQPWGVTYTISAETSSEAGTVPRSVQVQAHQIIARRLATRNMRTRISQCGHLSAQ